MTLGAPDIDRIPVLTRPGEIEPGGGDGLPSGGIIHPGHHVIPAQRAGLLGANADQQAKHDVRVQAPTPPTQLAGPWPAPE